ncbi:MAG: hypothetical protein H6707_00980 [Deltaproteobacteria bacterium]|nr:hypothetical protein [Deltaproteobacteria bacterium]
MRHCPNRTCRHRQLTKRPASYNDDARLCTDCGEQLVDGPAPVEPRVALGPAPYQRLLPALALCALWLLLTWLPLPGAPTVADATFPQGWFALGMHGFFAAFWLVELVALIVPRLRPWRNDQRRHQLVRASLVLGGLSLLLQAWLLYRYANSAFYPDQFSPLAPLCWLSASAALIATAIWISRHGIGEGFSWIVLLAVAAELVPIVIQLLITFSHGDRSLAQGMVWLASAIGIFAFGLSLQQRNHHRPPSDDPGAQVSALIPRPFPLPVAGLAPLLDSYQVVHLLNSLALINIDRPHILDRLVPGDTLYLLAVSICAVILTWLFGRLFALRRNVDQTYVQLGLTLRPRLSPREILLSMLLPIGLLVVDQIMLSWMLPGLPLVGLLLAAAIVCDLRGEWQARREQGALLPVWRLDRQYAVPAVRARLAELGIEIHARAAAHRSLLLVFGPYIPITILVPERHAEQARALLGQAFSQTPRKRSHSAERARDKQ